MKWLKDSGRAVLAAAMVVALAGVGPTAALAASSNVGASAAANGSNVTANGVTATTANPLDGRLGGGAKSFTAAYGKPTKVKGSGGVEQYAVNGFGFVAAAFLNSKAYEITLAADRLSHKPLTEADPADWTVANAARFADAVAPTDAAYAKPVKSTTKIEVIGHSAALAKSFTAKDYTKLQVAGTPGDFDVVYHLDTKGNVVSIDASLGNGAAVAASSATTGAMGTTTKAAGANATGNGAASGTVVHCKDFQTQADAQAYFDAHGGDANPAVSGMDGDKDGKPCESLP